MSQRTLKKDNQLRNACDFCTQSKLRCDHGKPSCRRCLERNQPCVYSAVRRRGRPLKTSARINTSRERSSRAGDVHQILHQSPSSATAVSVIRHGEQPRSPSTRNSDNADSTTSTPDQENGMASNTDFNSLSEHAIEFGSDFGFDIGNVLSENLMSNFPSFTFQGGVQKGLPTPQTTQEEIDSDSSGLQCPASLPLSMAYFASLDKPLELESQGHDRQSPTARPDRFFLSDAVDMERSLVDGSAFLEASILINAVTNRNKSGHSVAAGSYTPNDCLCCRSISLNTLQVLCFHPSLSHLDGYPPLDFVLLLEDYINQLYAAILRCSTCRSKSLHSLVSLCVCTDLILEMLRRAIQSLLSHRDNMLDSKVGLDCLEGGSSLCVGETCLDDQLWQSCIRSLLKHRINRLAAVVDRIGKLGYRTSGPLEEAFRTVSRGVLCKTESLLGMMEM